MLVAERVPGLVPRFGSARGGGSAQHLVGVGPQGSASDIGEKRRKKRFFEHFHTLKKIKTIISVALSPKKLECIYG